MIVDVAELVELDAYVPTEVREAARAAYAARVAYHSARAAHGSAMRRFADACDRFKLPPDGILVGGLVGSALCPARHPATLRRWKPRGVK